MTYPDGLADADEPTPDDLAAIEREWPLIEAEMHLLDTQVALLLADRRTTSELDWRRHAPGRTRRAERGRPARRCHRPRRSPHDPGRVTDGAHSG